MKHAIIIIPDVHGRKFWRNALPFIQDGTPVVFLGDYLDPYPHEGITPVEALYNFKDILHETEGRNNVIMLLGNHDMTYVAPDADICECRTDYDHFDEIYQLFMENASRFRFVWEPDGEVAVTFSHAGLHEKWLDTLDSRVGGRSMFLLSQTLDVLQTKPEYEEVCNCLSIVSSYRGGWGECGSVVWADIHEFGRTSDTLWPGLQIVGHTQQLVQEPTERGFKWVGGEPVRIQNVVCLDCHRCFYLDLEGDIRSLEDDKLVH